MTDSDLATKAQGVARNLTYNDDAAQAAAKHLLLGHKHAEMTALYLNDRGLTDADWKVVDAS